MVVVHRQKAEDKRLFDMLKMPFFPCLAGKIVRCLRRTEPTEELIRCCHIPPEIKIKPFICVSCFMYFLQES